MGFIIDDVSFYHDDQKVIDHISLTLSPGTFYGIIGPNGCGKTTLLDLLAKHRTPVSGTVFYRSKKLSAYSKKELSRHIALVPQNYHINFPFMVEEIVMMGRYPHIPRFSPPAADDVRIVEDIMEKTGIDGLRDRLITELSGGERQRVVFARALAQNTPVFILDEATANMDIRYTLHLLNTVKDQVTHGHKMVIAVFQDINLAATFCDELICMKNGAVAAHGDSREVLTPETIRSVFDVEAKVYFEPCTRSNQIIFKR